MSDEQLLYSLLERLDRLEELREDWLEYASAGLPPDASDPALRAELETAGVESLDDIERLMTELHAQVDQLDAADYAT